MKNMMKTVRPTRSKAYLKQKLISAGAMLLVSAILMVSTSYAWYVLSTAPEVSNIKTQVGANGALEIALLNADSWKTMSLLDMGDIDESLTDESTSAALANLTWGNLVNLDDASYGMDKIILNPARLNFAASSYGYTVNDVLLKTPVYGEDGRVKGLEEAAEAYIYADGTFSGEGGYGVRAIGTVTGLTVFQENMRTARNSIGTYAAAAGDDARLTLEENGGALATIVVDHVLNDKDEYTAKEIEPIIDLAADLDKALTEIENALRQVFAAYITTADAAYDEEKNPTGLITSENYQDKLDEINDSDTSLESLLNTYSGVANLIPKIEDYISLYNADKASIKTAQKDLNDVKTTVTWTDLTTIVQPLVDINAMDVNGSTVEELMAKASEEGLSAVLGLMTGGNGITITVPSGSGILSDIADFSGQYSANVPVDVTVTLDSSTTRVNTTVLMTTVPVSPTYLSDCRSKLAGATVAETAETAGITDYYGYAIDLAFRTNAVESNLLLQTEPENRIYKDESQTALQGGGSYMSFTASTGLSVSKVVSLMRGIRVVLMDGDQNILAIAALDCTLGQNNYEILDSATQSATGMYAYLKGSAGDYQNSDLISKDEYDILDKTSEAVQFNSTTGKVTAKLYLYDFERTTSKNADGTVRYEDEENGIPYYTGGLTLSDKHRTGETAAVITNLTQDVPKKVTALVYLDGSYVHNDDVAANAGISMSGTLNLQFSSSAELMPATNTELQSSSSDVVYTELSNELYEAGYLGYDGTYYKVATGYCIYEGSDGKFYYAQSDVEPTGETVTELTASTITNALEPVTATLTPSESEVSVEVNSTTELTTTLSAEDLTIEEVTFARCDDGTEELVTYTVDTAGKITLTGKTVGEGTYKATVKLITENGQEFTVVSNEVSVTVNEASGE